MSDIAPNLDLRKKQISIRLSELRLNLDRMDLRKMEIEEERKKILDNEKATQKAIEELQKEK